MKIVKPRQRALCQLREDFKNKTNMLEDLIWGNMGVILGATSDGVICYVILQVTLWVNLIAILGVILRFTLRIILSVILKVIRERIRAGIMVVIIVCVRVGICEDLTEYFLGKYHTLS